MDKSAKPTVKLVALTAKQPMPSPTLERIDSSLVVVLTNFIQFPQTKHRISFFMSLIVEP